MEFFSAFMLAFIPILVAMDAVGVLPIYVSLIEGMEPKGRRQVLLQALITAAVVGVLFVVLGKAVFSFLGITVADFKVAGGLVLLIFSINDLLFAEKTRRKPTETVGVVPIGMPLVVGPAVLTALVVQAEHVGLTPTLLAFAVNLVLTLLVFSFSDAIVKAIGKGGAQGVSKVANLLLAAIAVMIIRSGLTEIIRDIL